VLVIHLLRHYSTVTQTITEQKLTLYTIAASDRLYSNSPESRFIPAELASVVIINLLPVYSNRRWDFAASVCDSTAGGTGKVDVIENGFGDRRLPLQVGFSQSHLTQQFKRATGLTPKQVR